MSLPIDPTGLGTRVFSGARARFYFNGEPLAFGQGVNGSVQIRYDPVETLDALAVVEHVPVSYNVQFSCSVYRTISPASSTSDRPGSLVQQGIFPKFGTRGEAILRMLPVLAMIQDSNTNKVIYVFRGVKPENLSFDIMAKGLVTQNLSFVATHLLDEAEAAGLANALAA